MKGNSRTRVDPSLRERFEQKGEWIMDRVSLAGDGGVKKVIEKAFQLVERTK